MKVQFYINHLPPRKWLQSVLERAVARWFVPRSVYEAGVKRLAAHQRFEEGWGHVIRNALRDASGKGGYLNSVTLTMELLEQIHGRVIHEWADEERERYYAFQARRRERRA